jgi:streptogramin lyase
MTLLLSFEPAAADPVIIEYSAGITASSKPYQICAGPDGNLWFAQYSSNQIGRITPTGAVTEFTIPGGNNPACIAAGPDGNLWFTESNRGVGRISTAGSITIVVPSLNHALGIAAGPDGNLWVAIQTSNAIARITPGGAVTSYAVPTAGATPSYITAGPDGNLWFTEFTANKIGRLNPTTGTITEFALVTVNSYPDGITAGPDGNIWFCEFGNNGITGTLGSGNTIGRINPTTGELTEFTAGITPDSGTGDITSGPDGNLWFTESKDRVGRITPTGTVTEFSLGITSGAGPCFITTGSDGNLWFTEINGNRIGEVVIPEPATLSLMALGLGGLTALRRRHRQR